MSTRSVKIIHSNQTRFGKRTYTIIVRAKEDRSKELVIIEERKLKESTVFNKITIPQTHLPDFLSCIIKASNILGFKPKAHSVEVIRQQHPRAYATWTKGDDERLCADFLAGLSIKQLSRDFQRNEGAIRSRLNKLGIEVTTRSVLPRYGGLPG